MNSRLMTIACVLGLLPANGPAQAYVYLRQTGNSNPNGSGVYQSGSGLTGGGAILPFFFSNNTPFVLQLSHGTMGVSAYTDDGLKTSGIYASAWTVSGFLNGNPLNPGDLVGHIVVPIPTITPVGAATIFGVA